MSGIRMGIIGTGRIAVDSHVPHLRIAGGDVVALSDAVPGRAARFASELGVPAAFDDYHDLLASSDVDAVAICTPPNVRPQIAIAALQAGKHVYLEKPPALTAAALRPVVETARARNLRLLVGSHQVYSPEIQEARRLVADGELGSVYYVEALKLIRRGIPRGWHRSRAIAGGGVSFDSAPHRLDLALFLLGNPAVRTVAARTYDAFADLAIPDETPGYRLMDVEEGIAPPPAPADVEDTLIAMIGLEGGTTLLVRDVRIAHMRPNWEFKLLGTNAGLELTPAYAASAGRPLVQIYRDGPDGTPDDGAAQVEPDARGTHVGVYEHFFACIRSGSQTSSSGDRALAVMTILDAIHASARDQGRTVEIEERV